MKPRTRLEKFLAKIAGLDVKISPKTRKEYWLDKISIRAKEAKELPAVDGEDNKALLSVSKDGNNNYVWQTVPLDTVADNLERMGYRFAPDASPEYAGMVPTVLEDGSYALAEAGGASPLYVTWDGIGADKIPTVSYQECLDAYSEGRLIVFWTGGNKAPVAGVATYRNESFGATLVDFYKLGETTYQIRSHAPKLSADAFTVETAMKQL